MTKTKKNRTMNNFQKKQILQTALNSMDETFSSNEFMKAVAPGMGSRRMNMIYGHRKFLVQNCVRVNKKSWTKKETSEIIKDNPFATTSVSSQLPTYSVVNPGATALKLSSNPVATPELFPNTFKAKEEQLLHDLSDLEKIQSEEERVNEAIKLLKSKGYKILKPSFQEL